MAKKDERSSLCLWADEGVSLFRVEFTIDVEERQSTVHSKGGGLPSSVCEFPLCEQARGSNHNQNMGRKEE